MRGRRGHSSSSVSQKQTRMALRKQILKDAADVPSGSQPVDENMQEEEAVDDNDELSTSLLSPASSREKCRREREAKSKPKEMTEEEMMDLALRLSEQEASITALRLQKEEEAVMRAIQESMVGQTQACSLSQRQSQLTDAEASLRLCSRRKLLYSNRKAAAEDVCSPETDLNQGAKGSGDESNNRNKKRKREEESPLLEMPDLSQTQKIFSQASPSSSECLSVALDSPQSSDSTQIDDCQLQKSPVFPSTGVRAQIHVPRLSQELLETCRTSGFVLCTQDSWTSPQKPPAAQPRSPTFPKSPEHSRDLTLSKSPVFSETNMADDGEIDQCPDYFKSPVFGRNTELAKSPSACKPRGGVSTSGFMFSSQESLISSVSSTCRRPVSPVFPRSPGPPKSLPPPERPAACTSPIISEPGRGLPEQRHSCCTSPVCNSAGPRRDIDVDVEVQERAAAPRRDRKSAAATDPPHSLRLDDHNQDIILNMPSRSDEAEELKEGSKDSESAESELTSDLTRLWSDEDEDVTPVASPSPVFPEERPADQAEGRRPPLSRLTAASPGTAGSRCRPPSSSSAGQQQQSSAGPTTTVHYYWGVPFCPRGLDPDTYTQVILAQMEVYEKSLKQAQRCLLRKAEWGEAVLPEPEKSPSPEPPAESSPQLAPQRRGLRLRRKKLSDAADSPPVEVEEEADRRDEEEEEEERESKEEEKTSEGEREPLDTDYCEVCPETPQQSDVDDDRTQAVALSADPGPELQPNSSKLLEFEVILRDDSPSMNKPQEDEGEEKEEAMEVEGEVDAPADAVRKGKLPVCSSSDADRHDERTGEVEEDRRDPHVEDIKDRGLQRSTSPEVEAAAAPQSSRTAVDCPICQGSFPVTTIEMHAAYCDGEVAVVDKRRPDADSFKVSLKPRRKRTRRAEVTAEETNDHDNPGRNQEKCFICQKAVPLRDYSKHTELCIRRQAPAAAAKGNLLSALDQTESEAGPSGSKFQPGDVIDLRDDDEVEEVYEEEGGISAIRISNSPIRSFTPISEATGCLIDFKKQQRSKRLCQRRR